MKLLSLVQPRVHQPYVVEHSWQHPPLPHKSKSQSQSLWNVLFVGLSSPKKNTRGTLHFCTRLSTHILSKAQTNFGHFTTQSVSVPHFSKCSLKLSSVVSKLRPPMNSFLNCSGSLGSWPYKIKNQIHILNTNHRINISQIY